MRPLSLKQRRALGAKPATTPAKVGAPVGGWNTRDALTEMDPLDAIVLDNFYPDLSGVSSRQGYSSFATGVGSGPVQTLAEFNAGSTRKFLAAASNAIYDISAGGVAGAPLASGFNGNQWQTANFLSRMFLANGTDTLQIYDGATLANSTFTGVTLSTLVGVFVYQQRLYFWANNSTGFWYASLNSIAGALTFYDLATFAPRGGNLVNVTSFSHDGNAGVQDLIIFMMSSGSALVFQGNDPGNASAWTMVGQLRLSPPVNIRAVCQYGAEAFLTTFDDHVPLDATFVALHQGKLPDRSKISPAVQAAVSANQSGFGWQALYYPRGRRLIFNVPNPDGSFWQHVQNTGSSRNPWCRFKDMNAFTWGLYQDRLYFGASAGNVYLADTGTQDAGQPISVLGQHAWNDFQDPHRKDVKAVRPVLTTSGPITFTYKLGFDFRDPDKSIIVTTTGTGAQWDVSPWDTTPWSAESTPTTLWSAGGGTGQALSASLSFSSSQSVTWLRSDYRGTLGVGL